MKFGRGKAEYTVAEVEEWNKSVNLGVGKITPRKGKTKIDVLLLIAIIALAAIGLCMVLSTSHYSSLLTGKTGISAYEDFIDQAKYVIIGAALMVGLLLMPDYVWIKKYAMFLWIIGMVLLLMVLAFPSSANGADRWLKIGPIKIQPSEFVKYFVLAAMAAYLQKRYKPTNKRFFILLLLFVIPTGLIFLQKALSMSIVLLGMGFIILLVSGTDAKKLVILASLGLVGGFAGLRFEEFRWTRTVAFAKGEWSDQTRQSLYALGNGGLFGRGMAGSRQKYGFLSESDTDFIFAIFGEEFGFVGVLVLVALYAFIIWRGIKIAMNARCRFGAYMAMGIISFFALQAIINMAVATNLIPVTGQTLPFISRGGSSIIANFGAFGILLNISRDIYE